MIVRARVAVSTFIVLFALSTFSAFAAGRPENKWRIQCSEGAKSDGEIVFLVTPEHGEAIEVRVPIKRGTSENHVAKRIRDVFRETLPKDDYHIEVADGEDVLVKKKLGGEKFYLEVVDIGVKAVRINLDRE